MDFGELLDRSRSEIYIFDAADLRFLHVNRGAAENLGFSMEELRELTPLDIKPEFTREAFEEMIAPLRSGAVDRHLFATVHKRKDGSIYPVDVHLFPETYGDKSVFIAIILDVSERRRAEERAQVLEEQLRQAQRVEAIGRLAGGVAHDFNNLLTVILSSAHILKKTLTPSQIDDLAAITDAATKAADLTRQLLAFGRRQTLEPRTIALNDSIEGLRSMLSRLVREDIELDISLAPDLHAIRVDPVQIEQVLVNLVTNARDAMPRGGTLTITTSNTEAAAADGETRPFVCLAVSDTGAGMDEETRAHIFEPFFSTKSAGEGTGLGLATVHGIVIQSGGQITVESRAGAGTTFRILLPGAAHAAPDQAVAEDTHFAPRARDATILLVEDNDAVRRAARIALDEARYVVLDAGGAEEALDASRRHRGRIDLLITDVVMPKMDGRTLARQLRLERPEVRVLFVSGYADGVVAGEELATRGEHFLQKPFTPATLCKTTASILSTP